MPVLVQLQSWTQMKILFLCRGNVGRSVFAEHLYNKLTKSNDAISAGSKLSGPEEPLKILLPRIQSVFDAMGAEGLDASSHLRKSVTPEMVNGADVLVDMAEPETVPDFVKKHPNRIVWEIVDPKGTDYETHVRIMNQIKDKIVETFIK